jgi:hypothetical protein
MRIAKTVLVIGLLLAGSVASPQAALGYSLTHASESKAGQFCKSADTGKRKIADNGSRIKCVKDGSRSRWKNN